MLRIARRNRRRMVPVIDPMESRELLSTMFGHAPHAVAPAQTSAVVAPAQTSAVTGLHFVASPTVTRSILTATTAIAPNDIWAVGFANLAPNPQQLLAEHWNGSSWSVVPSPNPASAAGGSQFHGVAAAASNDVWAVGQTLTFDNTTGYTWHPLVEHWNGSTWSIVATPTLAGSGELNAVTVISSNNVWAVGGLGSGGSGNLIEHWDGTRWSVVAAPNISTSAGLLGISWTSANDIWAVGRVFRHPNVEILHFDGHTWSQVAAPSPAFDSVLTAVTALAPNNVWAVGETDVGPVRTLIEHWDGTSWSVVPSPSPSTGTFGSNVLTGVAAVSASDIWAVGTVVDPNTGIQHTLTEHWDGTSWTVIASPDGPSGNGTLAGVTALNSGTVVAIGTTSGPNGSSNGLILQK